MFVAGQVGERVVSPQVLLSMEEGLSSSHRLLVATHSIEKLPGDFPCPRAVQDMHYCFVTYHYVAC